MNLKNAARREVPNSGPIKSTCSDCANNPRPSRTRNSSSINRGFGVGKESKFGWLKNMCRVEKPNIMLLQETKLHTVDLQWICGLWGNQDCNFLQKEMVGKSGGQLIIWDTSYFDVSDSFVSNFFVGVRGMWKSTGAKFNLVNVYGPHDDQNKQLFWNQLHTLISNAPNDAWVISGDFNEVRSDEERLNCQFIESRAKMFNDFINNTKLIDIPLGGRIFTRVSDDDTKFSKLDRFIVNDCFHGLWNCLSVVALDRGKSDHCPIILKDDIKNFGPKPIKVFDEWLEMEDVDNSEIEVLKTTSNTLELKAERGLLHDVERKQWLDARNEWFRKEKIKVNMLKQKARVRWVLEGDENTRYFHSIIKRGYNKNNIRGLTINGVWCEDPNDIKEAVFHHFKSRFEEQPGFRPSLIDPTYPMLSSNEAISVEAPIS
ncbi:uncharacterized protein [Rutidosis leptorrhynchoides]|uniref:uncharacterized protein n=1 Tax=Rutidosis leptorrhynchoides TaxID=125765 RepID=UPI003A998D97